MDSDPDELEKSTAASLDRIASLFAETTAITREISGARDAAVARLDVAIAAGQRETATPVILGEIATSMDERAARFARVVTWLENEAASLDAVMTMWLDRAEQSVDDPGVRDALGRLTELGTRAASLAEQQRRVVAGLDSLAEHEALRRPAGRRAADLERMIAACGTLTSIGERAERMGGRADSG